MHMKIRLILSYILLFTVTVASTVLISLRLQNIQPPDTTAQALSENADVPFFAKLNALSFQESRSLAQSQQSVANFVGGQVRAQHPVDIYKLELQISVEDGSLSPITSLIYVPKGSNKNEKFPLVVYAPGTTGVDDRCAPSREDPRNPRLGNYRNQMIAIASQGFVVAMPNYEGLDNPDRIHYYFNADLESRTLLGTAKILTASNEARQLPIQPNTLFFGGYSQGGHASFAAADNARLYTPEMRVSGIFGHGPTTNIRQFLLSNPNLALYFAYAYQAYYGEKFPAEKILTSRLVQNIGAANNLCVDQAFAYNSTRADRTYNAEFLKALRENTIESSYPEIAETFKKNDAGLDYQSIPTLILQGQSDPIVTLAAQKDFTNKLCQNNVPVFLKQYPGLNHFDTRAVSFNDTNTWIRTVAQGGQVPTTCLVN
jgi:dienelactone hydrolase